MIRLSSMAVCLAAAALVACRTPPPTRAQLLEKLHQCRDELATGKAKTPGWFVSPCTKLDLAPLSGVSRAELVSVLGQPTFCVGMGEGSYPGGPDCAPQLDPKWAFYKGGGSGPELTCETDEKQHCELVRWLRSD
jgi:hypothetical protein